MKLRSTHSTTLRVIASVLLIQVANLCIDSVDPVFDKWGLMSQGENLLINEIESIYELISEEILNIDVPENDEDDKDHLLEVTDFILTQKSIELNNAFRVLQASFSRVELRFHSVILDHTSPPPKGV